MVGYLVWTAALAAAIVSGAQDNIEFGDLKCKLPGWPGHPAPSCDPAMPDQCCAGTKCLPDPFDASHNTCQQSDSVSAAEHALTADVLGSHVESLLKQAVAHLKVASTSLYLSDKAEQTHTNRAIAMRAQRLSRKNHGDEKSDSVPERDKQTHGGKGKDAHPNPKKDDDDEDEEPEWHKLAHGGQGNDAHPKPIKDDDEEDDDKTTSFKKPKGKSSVVNDQPPNDGPGGNGGGFDYTKYYNGGGSGQGGFDYSKYMPKNIPNNDDKNDDKDGDKKDAADTKKDSADTKKDNSTGDKKKTDKNSKDPDDAGEGKGGFDYSQYWPSGGDPHKKGYQPKPTARPTVKGDASNQDQNGFDYSQYYPKQKNLEQTTKNDDDADILKKAALELLEADVQLRTASAQAKRDVLARVKVILDRLEDMVDRELDDDDGDDDDDSGATKSPTLVWNDPNDFWSKYIPKMPSQGYGQGQGSGQGGSGQGQGGQGQGSFNTGDRRPGTLGGPCGRTSYKDFGPCVDDLKCEGMNANKPGLCEMDKATSVLVARRAALASLKLADDVSRTIKAAAVELLVGASQKMNLKDSDTSSGKRSSEEDFSLSLNSTLLEIRDSSPMTLGVVALGFAVIGYFCWMNTSKRKSYQSLDGWGANDRA